MCEESLHNRVQAPVTNHSKDCAPDVEKYKMVQIFPYTKIERGGLQNFQ